MSPEGQLIDKAIGGNISAFEELILQYEKRIYNYCYRMTNNQADAEDLAQEVFIKAYRGLQSFKSNSQFSTWIYRIAYNTCVDMHRKRKAVVLSLSLDPEEKDRDLPSQEPLPEDQIISKEQYTTIKQCIATLRPEYKAVIILRDVQNHTYEEVADILDIPLGTVKSHISRGRAALRDALEARGIVYGLKGVE